MPGFISAIEKSFDWKKFQSRMSIAEEAPAYTLEQAIADYSKWSHLFKGNIGAGGYKKYLADIRYFNEEVSPTLSHHIQEIITQILCSYSEYRNKYRIHYPLYLLMMTVIIARNYGNTDAESIADFYNEHYLELFITFPEVPCFIAPMSASTIRTAMRMISADECESFFEKYFTKIKILIQDQVKYDEENFCERGNDIADTIAFDGQEMKETFRRGETSRRHKGGIVTQLFNSTQRTALACAITPEKNNEKSDVIPLIGRVNICGQVVMCDKLNSTPEVSSAVNDAEAYYLLPLGDNNGNKELHSHLEGIFNRNHKKAIKYSETELDEKSRKKAEIMGTEFRKKKAIHGRREYLDIELLPATYLDPRIKNPHQGVSVLVKKTKTVVTVRNHADISETRNETYYISSIPYDEDYSIRQVTACFQDYWQIEENHSVLDDECILNQDNLQACNSNTIYNTAILNKICMPLISYMRQRFSIEFGRTSRPFSYKKTMNWIQKMPIWYFMEFFCDYWFDKEDDKN